MSKIIYTYEDLGYAVKLNCINLITLECGVHKFFLHQQSEDRLLQGDDASYFLDEVYKLLELLKGIDCPSHQDFCDYENRLNDLIEPYF
jgi:hypothetical protein